MLLRDVCVGKKVDRTPLWMMRQAGRYLPEYQVIRKKYDFKAMMQTPELITEVTLQPIRRFGFDAAILFSDILTIPEAMGHEFQLKESVGPVFRKPVQTVADIQALAPADMQKVAFVFEGIRQVRRELEASKALIGFAGAPWTIATYLVEGGSSKDYRKIRALMYQEPSAFHQLMTKLTDGIIAYLKSQIEAGLDFVQVFDTNAAPLSREAFEIFSLPYLKRIATEIRKKGTPLILFFKGVACFDLLKGIGADFLGVDWTHPLKEVREIVGEGLGLQGNLDPSVLLTTPKVVKEEVKKVLESYGYGGRHIFNLGHGISPDASLENVETLVEAVKELSPEYH